QVFFFASRRRHTRCYRDWSSDVCSSDLRKLLTEAEAGTTTPEELAQLVFEPGFSTSTEVTDLAGRGMGLSIVQVAVQRLQGDVQDRKSVVLGKARGGSWAGRRCVRKYVR